MNFKGKHPAILFVSMGIVKTIFNFFKFLTLLDGDMTW